MLLYWSILWKDDARNDTNNSMKKMPMKDDTPITDLCNEDNSAAVFPSIYYSHELNSTKWWCYSSLLMSSLLQYESTQPMSVTWPQQLPQSEQPDDRISHTIFPFTLIEERKLTLRAQLSSNQHQRRTKKK